jgi:hypothetical protein
VLVEHVLAEQLGGGSANGYLPEPSSQTSKSLGARPLSQLPLREGQPLVPELVGRCRDIA